MNEKNELEWDVDKDMLQRHAVTVMEGLGAAVESLDDSDFLNSVLVSIGQTHIKRNVKPQMLRRLWPSLNEGFSKMLGERYNKETMDAWRRLYNYISFQMKKGMSDPDGKLLDDDVNTLLYFSYLIALEKNNNKQFYAAQIINCKGKKKCKRVTNSKSEFSLLKCLYCLPYNYR
ncbi:hypothetical protein Btru_032566 [Bulinus truncatus]|nr:hypothetical protein Btru_032566 [Bulinus truncatus]